MDVVENDLCVETLGVFVKSAHQCRSLHAHCVGGPVVHVSGGHELSALGKAGNDYRVEVGAGGVHCRGISGRAGTENDKTRMFACHCLKIMNISCNKKILR